MKREWWMLLAGVIFLFIVSIGAGVYFFLSDLFEPPVDTSGISISSAYVGEELLPARLINGSLNRGTVSFGWKSGFRDGVSYYVDTTSADYNGITLHVLKADTATGATKAFEDYYDDPFEDYVSGSTHKTITPWWFTYEGGGTNGFAWSSGVWIFGVEAENDEARNQATAEWVQQLRGY